MRLKSVKFQESIQKAAILAIMILTCIIINRDLHFIDQLKKYEELLPFLKINAYFTNTTKAKEYLHQNDIDIIFTDIQFIEGSDSLFDKHISKNTEIILCLDHPSYEFKTHCLSAIEYILKPITFEKFTKSLHSIYYKKINTYPQSKAVRPAKNFFFVKNGSVIEKVKYNDVLFFKGLKDYIWIQTKHKKIITLQTMKSLYKKLPADQFVRIHKSYIISLEHIEYIDRNSVSINNERIPIGETFKNAFFSSLKNLDVLWC